MAAMGVLTPFAVADTPCCADVDDGSGTGAPDGAVNVDDLLYFLWNYAAGDAHIAVFCQCVNPPPCFDDLGQPVDCCFDQAGFGPLLWFLIEFERGC